MERRQGKKRLNIFRTHEAFLQDKDFLRAPETKAPLSRAIGTSLLSLLLILQLCAFAPRFVFAEELDPPAYADEGASATSFTLTDADKEMLESLSGRTLKLGYFASFGYFENEQGEESGFLVPLVKVLAGWGLQVVPQKISTMTDCDLWSEDDVDIYGSVTLTRDLAATYACSDSLYETELFVVMPRNGTIENINNLAGKRIGILPEPGMQEALATHLEADQQPRVYSTIDELLAAADQGEIDVAVCSFNIQGEAAGRENLSYKVIKGEVPFDKGLVATDEELRPLIELINRYLSSEEGVVLRADTAESIDDAVIDNVREKLKGDIATIQAHYDEISVLGNDELYPFSFTIDGQMRGIMIDSVRLFEDITGVPVTILSPDAFSSVDEVIAAQEEGKIQALMGIHKSSQPILSGVYSVPVSNDKEMLYKRVESDFGDKTVAELSVGVSADMYPNVAWQMFFGDHPISYLDDCAVLDALDKGEIDLALISKMTFDYHTLFKNNYEYERFDSTVIETELCLNFDAKNLPELNRVMNEVITLYGSSYAYQYADWSKEAVDYQQDYIRAQDEQQRQVFLFGGIVALFAVLLLAALLFALHEFRKYSRYDREIRELIGGQDMIDIGFGDFKKNTLTSKGDWPLMRKIGLSLPHTETLSFDLLSEGYGFDFRERYWTLLKEMRSRGERMLVREMETGRGDKGIFIRQYLYSIDESHFSFYTIDISHEKAAMASLKEQADFDNLSGVYRRRAFTEIATEVQGEYEDNAYMAIFDIDFFKKVNDNYGHDVGDKVIRMVADTLNALFKDSGCVGRWGGEEFLALFPGKSKEEAMELVQEALCTIEDSHVVIDEASDKKIQVTVSAGIAQWLEEDTVRSLVSKADTAMYRAKQSGRNCARYYEE